MKKERAYLVGITFERREDCGSSLEELVGLAQTAGLEVVGSTFQYVREINPATIIGSGKLEEIKKSANELGVDVVISDSPLTGSQTRNLTDFIGIRVIDRTLLILDIFAQRAHSNEGKLQVKLALSRYYLPRLASLSGTSGRFGGAGVGMRGPGETKLELDRRIIAHEIATLEKEIKKIKERRTLNRSLRKKSGKKKIAIIGYTNAGKSTLLNALTKENIYADDKLFATLDTTTRTMWLGEGREVILTDTVGFINKLPHNLVDAFSATLEEASDADLLLHVVDASNPHFEKQVQVVDDVIAGLKTSNVPVLIAYNKCDKLQEVFIPPDKSGVLVCASKSVGLQDLRDRISKMIFI